MIFAPVGSLVPAAAELRPQGRHRGLRRHPHERRAGHALSLLWGERVVRSVANLTRQDAKDFLALAGRTQIETHVIAVCTK